MSDPHPAPTPAVAAAAATPHDSHSNEHDVSKDVGRYLFVFAALLVGTIVTVAASYIPFRSSDVNIAVALAIATVKATLVAAIFMHLSAEKWTIYRFLIITVVFAVGLFTLTAFALSDRIHL